MMCTHKEDNRTADVRITIFVDVIAARTLRAYCASYSGAIFDAFGCERFPISNSAESLLGIGKDVM